MSRSILNYVDDNNDERQDNLRTDRQHLRWSTDKFELYEDKFNKWYRMHESSHESYSYTETSTNASRGEYFS